MAVSPRFFVDCELVVHQESRLPPQVAHHALRVLRLADGAAITLFNGAGGEFHGRLRANGRDQGSFLADRFSPREAELAYRVRIGQGICAGDKMDWLLEKAVELGAASMAALSLQKCVARLAGERAEKRLGHWRQLIAAASEQCGRNRLLHAEPPQPLASWLARAEGARYRLVLDPNAEESLADFAKRTEAGAIDILIGPEAGLAEPEVSQARAQGLVPIHLGARILRTESAAMVALATLNAHWSP